MVDKVAGCRLQSCAASLDVGRWIGGRGFAIVTDRKRYSVPRVRMLHDSHGFGTVSKPLDYTTLCPLRLENVQVGDSPSGPERCLPEACP